ncbi:MAG: flavin reductase [Evtepia sp.]|uniref:flavin reductase n=1 Tax=Evtepia sp. TaxID=2773933 RepID=UPI002A74E758|nr:flavin reductase [Evtepia sp.]MDY3013945.1 flavin reductase [Evtepia sp.]
MYCFRSVCEDLFWIGGDDRRLSLFEGVYSVPNGVSYNSYLLLDQKTVLFDTVDISVSSVFFENLEYLLHGRPLDYLVIHHMEPDHSATLSELLLRYPETTLVCNKKSQKLIEQFFHLAPTVVLADENFLLETGSHTFRFLMMPMVHWPEVMMSYDETSRTLFSSDAFGSFGALNGAIFADEVDFDGHYMDEARRYYSNIMGKYGPQVLTAMRKIDDLDLRTICPLHGFVWRTSLEKILSKYRTWGSYTPEETGVMIAYASVYGNTANAATIVSSMLRERGIKTVMFDVSVKPTSDLVSAAFQYSHILFASTTYNAGIFISMEELLRDLVSHNIQNRTVAFVENGSWGPTSGTLMKELLSSCKDMRFVAPAVTIRSSLKEAQLDELVALTDALVASMPSVAKVDDSPPHPTLATKQTNEIDFLATHKFSYGLFLLTAKENEKENGCIINTAMQLTSNPLRISIAVNKQNYTHDMILRTGEFNVSVLTEHTSFDVFQRFGFQSGRTVNKFENATEPCTTNGIRYLKDSSNAVFSGHVIQGVDCGTHTLFIADVTEALVLSSVPSVTYAYYFANIKPKPRKAEEKKKGFVCTICGYVYEGDTLPDDFICPICKHPASDFEAL